MKKIKSVAIKGDAHVKWNEIRGIGMWWLKPPYTWIVLDEVAQKLYGFQREKITEEQLFQKVHPDERIRYAEMWKQYRENHVPFLMDHKVFHRGQSKGWRNTHAIIEPGADKNSRPIFCGTVMDITPYKSREEEYISVIMKADEMSKAKEEFLSIMSHEIRTPLNSIVGLSSLLLKKSPPDLKPLVRTLKSSSDHLLLMVNDILDFSKIHAGKMTIESIPFSLSHLLSEINSIFKQSAVEKGLKFNLVTSRDLPNKIKGDQTRIRQILNNLISNAIKFTRKGKVEVKIGLESIKNNRVNISFIVSDTGIGIAQDKIGIVFDPFVQNDASTARQFGGTGLGLTIVKRLVDAMQGSLHIESHVGQGSIFSVIIPFEHDAHGLAKESGKPESMEQIIKKLHSIKILYVEDVESNRFMMEKYLEEHGLVCDTANDGEEALRKLKENQYDLILSDLQMPGLSGFELLDKIRTMDEKTPVIAFTADNSTTAIEKIIQHGFQAYITKPFDFNKILRILHDTIYVKEVSVDFSYYHEIFNHKPEKILEVIRLVEQDFKIFENELRMAILHQDWMGLRKCLHRIEPICSNIKFKQCNKYINEIRIKDTFNTEVRDLCSNMLSLLPGLFKSCEQKKKSMALS